VLEGVVPAHSDVADSLHRFLKVGERPRCSQFRHFQRPRYASDIPTEAISMRYTSSDRLHRRERRVYSVTANRWNRIRPDEPPINHPARLNYLLKLLQQEISAEN
jgi:hypothetical protein